MAVATVEAGIAFLIATLVLVSVGIIEAVKATGNNFGITARHSQQRYAS